MPINPADPVAELVELGRHAAAAELAAGRGEHLRAAELYERIWDFRAAAHCRQLGGDLPGALRCALEARDEALAAAAADALDSTGDDGRRAALEVFAQKRRFDRAGAIAEALGELEQAAEHYRRAHMDLDAARLFSQVGRDREAQMLLARVIEVGEPGPERSRAHLELGLSFARQSRHEDAVRHLQEAAREPALRDRARRALIVQLAALGLRDAARDVLIEARQDDPTLPADVDSVVRAERPEPAPRQGDAQMVAGRYRLGALLGSGASGRVYRARDEVSGREVAVKLLAATHARGDASYERFVREAGIARSLRHPNLVEVYDFSADHGYLIMEYMAGDSLEKRVPLSGASTRRLCLDLLAGLELAHQRGVIHRDIKPANVFFDARGAAKLGDFGVAHLLDLGQTQTGGLIGTLAYMSPEQITGAPLTIAADLYALGVTLFECLTGRLPFQGPDFVAQHLGEEPPAPSSIAPVAPGWDEVLARLLAKSPDDRFASIAELRAAVSALELAAAHQPLVLPRAPAAQPASGSSTALPAQTEPKPKGEREGGRYQFETVISQRVTSTLARAVDTALDRSVLIERFAAQLDDSRERRLFGLARDGGPFLQRVLSYDRAAAVAIFEAPAGAPIADLGEPLGARDAARLLKRLARAVAPLHEHGRTHGGLDARTILLDDRGHPTVLVSGLDPIAIEPDTDEDVAEILAVVARAAGAGDVPGGATPDQAAAALIDAVVPGLDGAERAALSAMPLGKGEELYDFADALEAAVLRERRRGRAA